MSIKVTYDLLADNPERITLFVESPTYKLRFYSLCITLIISLVFITTIVGSWICHELWKNIVNSTVTNNTVNYTNTLPSAVVAITILYVIIDILLVISFGYYACRCYKLKKTLNTFNLNNSVQ